MQLYNRRLPRQFVLSPLLSKATEKEETPVILVPKKSLQRLRLGSEADGATKIPIPPKSPRRLMAMGSGGGGFVVPILERSPKVKGKRADVV
jgi:hypothetical protein